MFWQHQAPGETHKSYLYKGEVDGKMDFVGGSQPVWPDGIKIAQMF